ncbi:hypothetical protein COD14_06970 [Bacillus cereus]|nr:hypothetical protein COD14_06970 [Bacillus cereus]
MVSSSNFSNIFLIEIDRKMNEIETKLTHDIKDTEIKQIKTNLKDVRILLTLLEENRETELLARELLFQLQIIHTNFSRLELLRTGNKV